MEDKEKELGTDSISEPLLSDIELCYSEDDSIYTSSNLVTTRFSWIKKIWHLRREISIDKIRWLLVRFLFIGSLLGTFFFISAFMYMILYWKYMPVMKYEVPVYFQYGKQEQFAVAKVESAFKLRPGVSYDFILDMCAADIPGIPEKVGNFMIKMDLFKEDSVLLWFSTSRPVILPYRSTFVRFVSTALRLGPLLAGWTREKIEQNVFLTESLTVESNETLNLLLTITETKVSLYSVKLKITAHLSGLRYFMYHWKVTAAFFFIGSLFIAQIFLSLFIFLAWWLMKKQPEIKKRKIDGTHRLPSPFYDGSSQISVSSFRKFRRRGRSRSLDQNSRKAVSDQSGTKHPKQE